MTSVLKRTGRRRCHRTDTTLYKQLSKRTCRLCHRESWHRRLCHGAYFICSFNYHVFYLRKLRNYNNCCIYILFTIWIHTHPIYYLRMLYVFCFIYTHSSNQTVSLKTNMTPQVYVHTPETKNKTKNVFATKCLKHFCAIWTRFCG